MGTAQPSSPTPPLTTSNPLEKAIEKKKGPCCVCKDTKKTRDECIVMRSEEECQSEIMSHKECLRSHGFDSN